MGRRLGGVGGHLTGRFGWRPPAAGRADRDSGGLEIAARRLANERRSPLRCGGAASPAAPERESAASCHPPRGWPFRRGTMRSTAASTSWDGATSLAGFQVSTTGRFWVSTEDGQGRNGPPALGFQGSKLLDQRVSVDIRQSDVADQDVWVPLLHVLECLLRARGRHDLSP